MIVPISEQDAARCTCLQNWVCEACGAPMDEINGCCPAVGCWMPDPNEPPCPILVEQGYAPGC